MITKLSFVISCSSWTTAGVFLKNAEWPWSLVIRVRKLSESSSCTFNRSCKGSLCFPYTTLCTGRGHHPPVFWRAFQKFSWDILSMKVDQVRDKCNTREECLWSLCVLVIAWRDACFRGYVTSKSVNNLHEYTFQFFCYVYLNLVTQKDSNFLARESQQIVVV